MDFWAAFLRNEYAVLASNEAEHDVFMEECLAATGCEYRHEWHTSYPYLYWCGDRVDGWTGTAGFFRDPKTISFAQWCEMATVFAEDTLQPDLSEVI